MVNNKSIITRTAFICYNINVQYLKSINHLITIFFLFDFIRYNRFTYIIIYYNNDFGELFNFKQIVFLL